MNLTNEAQALHAAVLRGQMITRKDNQGRDCSLWRNSAYEFVMVKQGGEQHTLDVAFTDAARLQAHWDGFCGVKAQEPKLFRGLRVGDGVSVFRNQGDRDGVVLAVLGDEALIRYEMPSGVQYMNIVPADGSDEPGAYRAISEKGLPKKWRLAQERAMPYWQQAAG